ncbi:hypothetical protein VP01_1919g3 [Puccinia sorghi]|uniref:Uncharacterized protein n=1 Tax=Puccinia sorghi TaxID=27349 RepID=A0A0L6VD73_9BASI|nr:hypothetical protein VP01_1919g3 [Puccinia sorghi]
MSCCVLGRHVCPVFERFYITCVCVFENKVRRKVKKKLHCKWIYKGDRDGGSTVIFHHTPRDHDSRNISRATRPTSLQTRQKKKKNIVATLRATSRKFIPKNLVPENLALHGELTSFLRLAAHTLKTHWGTLDEIILVNRLNRSATFQMTIIEPYSGQMGDEIQWFPRGCKQICQCHSCLGVLTQVFVCYQITGAAVCQVSGYNKGHHIISRCAGEVEVLTFPGSRLSPAWPRSYLSSVMTAIKSNSCCWRVAESIGGCGAGLVVFCFLVLMVGSRDREVCISNPVAPELFPWNLHANVSLKYTASQVELRMKLVVTCIDLLSSFQYEFEFQKNIKNPNENVVINTQGLMFYLEIIITHISYGHRFMTLIFFFYVMISLCKAWLNHSWKKVGVITEAFCDFHVNCRQLNFTRARKEAYLGGGMIEVKNIYGKLIFQPVWAFFLFVAIPPGLNDSDDGARERGKKGFGPFLERLNGK